MSPSQADLVGGTIIAPVTKMGSRMPKNDDEDDYLMLKDGPEWSAMPELKSTIGIPIMNIPLRLIYFEISTVILPLARTVPVGIWHRKRSPIEVLSISMPLRSM